jgi:hypothetical protein
VGYDISPLKKVKLKILTTSRILDCAFAFIQHLSTKRSDTLLKFHFLIFYTRCHYIYNISVHCRKIYIVFVRAVEQVEKNQALGKLFWPVSQRVQINFIFTDDVRIMCFYCNIKKSIRTAKLSEKSRNKNDSNGVFYHVRTYTVPFLTVALNESGTSKAL